VNFSPLAMAQPFSFSNGPPTKRNSDPTEAKQSTFSFQARPEAFKFTQPKDNAESRTKSKSKNAIQLKKQSAKPNQFKFNLDLDDAKEAPDHTLMFGYSSASCATRPRPREIVAQRKTITPRLQSISNTKAKITTMETQIEQLQVKLFALMEQKVVLSKKVKQMDSEIETWKKNSHLWNADDFKMWVQSIDGGYFRRKYEQIKEFYGTEYTLYAQRLNTITKRINEDDNVKFNEYSFDELRLFRGKLLPYFDVLDVQSVFPCLDASDARKLLAQIQKLTNSGADSTVDLMCSVCTTSQKDSVLGCGHVFCAKCISKMSSCAVCKKRIKKNKIRKVFL